MKRLLLALLATLWLAGCGGGSSLSGLGWLRAAARAERTVAWRGQLHLSAAGALASVAVEADGRGRQRRVHLDGPCRALEVIAAGQAEWRRQGQGAWTSRALPAAPGLDLDERDLTRIAANYLIVLAKAEPVAGRRCVRLDLRPRHRGNLARRLWLDAENGLILRSEQRNHRGVLLATTQVGELDLAARPTIDLPRSSQPVHEYPLADLTALTDARQMAELLGEAMPLPTWLPAGYTLHGYFARTARSGRLRPVATFSDGLNVVTLFDRGMGRGRQFRGGNDGPCLMQSGEQANVATVSRPDREWVVIGDLPERQLRRLATSIR
ncbi:MAG: hypothetical protein HZB16_11905 [Armatimonadetes bacterium]|nr:hypothetical protein [Armatimonadota bacterium]